MVVAAQPTFPELVAGGRQHRRRVSDKHSLCTNRTVGARVCIQGDGVSATLTVTANRLATGSAAANVGTGNGKVGEVCAGVRDKLDTGT